MIMAAVANRGRIVGCRNRVRRRNSPRRRRRSMHKNRRAFGLAAFVAALMLMAGMIAGIGGRASAQDEEADAPHPAHIHTGSCAAPGDVVFPLSDVSAAGSMDGTPMAGSWVGSEDAIEVESSVTTVQSSLQDLVASPHAIVAHES